MHEIITLGEAMAVFYPHEPIALTAANSLQCGIAGAEANLAITLSRLGHQVSFVSRVGDDPFGRRIRATLADEGVIIRDIITDAVAPSGLFFREWLPDGERRGVYYRAGSAASRLTPDALTPQMFAQTRLLHVTGITAALSVTCLATVAHAMTLAHAAGAQVAFDPNYRAALWSPMMARATLLPLMAQADILLLGHEDSRALFEVEEQEAALQAGRTLGCHLVVYKQAERGACAWDGTTLVVVPAFAIDAELDPVGAGDAFDAGFLAGWLRGYSLAGSLHLGARLGAATAAFIGDYLSLARFQAVTL